jgi:hypothetical protein
MEATILSTFKASNVKDGVAELELRFRDITSVVFEKVFNNFAKTREPTFECSVFIINELNKTENERRELYYSGGVIFNERYNKKKRLYKNVVVSGDIPYVIGLSLETPTSAISVNVHNLLRFRMRCSVNFESHGLKWRLDMTVIKEGLLKVLESTLASIRAQFCAIDLTADTYISHIRKLINIVDRYEIEVEYLDDPNILTDENIRLTAHTIQQVINPEHSNSFSQHKLIQEVADFIYPQHIANKYANPQFGFRTLVPQVKTLTKSLYNTIFPPINYFLLEKTDGIRSVVILNRDNIAFLNSNGGKVLDAVNNSHIVIADCEYEDDVYKILDIMYCDKNLVDMGFEERYTYADEVCKILATYIKCVAKTPVKLGENFAEQIKTIYTTAKNIDGLIFVEPDKSYVDTVSYKWKPYEHNTIDFYVKKMPNDMMGVKPYMNVDGKTLYLLFNGINHYEREKIGLGLIYNYKKLFRNTEYKYYPVQFSPSINPLAYMFYSENPDLDSKIMELSRNKDNTDWLIVRERTDRISEKNYYGNAFQTAEIIFSGYYDEFRLQDLYTSFSGYFSETTTSKDTYWVSNKYKRMVIDTLFKKYIKSSKVIDLAIGRGGDLNRYRDLRVQELLGIDIDKNAITTLIERKFTVMGGKKKTGGDDISNCEEEYRRIQAIEYNKLIAHTGNMVLHAFIANLKTPFCELSARCGEFGYLPESADNIVCNFAIHYLCDLVKNVKNILSLVKTQLKLGGNFLFTTLNGEKVFNILASGNLEYIEDGIPKYRIDKKYKGNTIANVGQEISTLIPVSNTMMDEPLCNITYIIDEAKKMGFELVERDSFSSYKESFNNSITNSMTDYDWKYVDLYEFVILKKVKKLTTRK